MYALSSEFLIKIIRIFYRQFARRRSFRREKSIDETFIDRDVIVIHSVQFDLVAKLDVKFNKQNTTMNIFTSNANVKLIFLYIQLTLFKNLTIVNTLTTMSYVSYMK